MQRAVGDADRVPGEKERVRSKTLFVITAFTPQIPYLLLIVDLRGDKSKFILTAVAIGLFAWCAMSEIRMSHLS